MFKKVKYLIWMLLAVVLMNNCKKSECLDPTNPECSNYEPCLKYPSAKAGLKTYNIINDLIAESDTFLNEQSIMAENTYLNGKNRWYLNNVFETSNVKRIAYFNIYDNKNCKITLENRIIRNEECKTIKHSDSTFKYITILEEYEKGYENSAKKPINRLCKWFGNFKGYTNHSQIKFNEVQIKEKKQIIRNLEYYYAELSFPNDSCLGSFLIDVNLGFLTFKSDNQLNSPNCNFGQYYFPEIYGIVNKNNEIIINFIYNNEKFTFYGKKN